MNDNVLKIAGAVVLYNPDDDVIGNIKSYYTQLSYLIVIDNSEVNNCNVINFVSTLLNAEYINHGKNLGIAAAFNIAANKAIKKSFDYLLTMDQDSIAPNNLISEMIRVIVNIDNIGIISPFHQIKNYYKNTIKNTIEEVSHTMTSGNLLNLNSFQIAGKFLEEFFIDFVDVEYCWRLKLHGYKIIQVNSLKLNHKLGNIFKINIFSHPVHPLNHAPIRMYYMTRNLFYLRKQYNTIFKLLVKKEVNHFIKTVLKMLLFEKNKFYKTKMILKGYSDYKNNITGKFVY